MKLTAERLVVLTLNLSHRPLFLSRCLELCNQCQFHGSKKLREGIISWIDVNSSHRKHGNRQIAMNHTQWSMLFVYKMTIIIMSFVIAFALSLQKLMAWSAVQLTLHSSNSFPLIKTFQISSCEHFKIKLMAQFVNVRTNEELETGKMDKERARVE